MEKLMLSMMRFSAAVTMFGMEQMQNAMNTVSGNEDLDSSIDRMAASLDAVTDSLVSQMDKSKKDVVESVKRTSEEPVHLAMKNLGSAMDPREAMKVAGNFMQSTSESVENWTRGASSGSSRGKTAGKKA